MGSSDEGGSVLILRRSWDRSKVEEEVGFSGVHLLGQDKLGMMVVTFTFAIFIVSHQQAEREEQKIHRLEMVYEVFVK